MIIVSAHNEICLNKKTPSHSFEVRDKTLKCVSDEFIYLSNCDNVTKFFSQCRQTNDVLQWQEFFQVISAFLFCLFLLVRWIFHLTGFTWVKKKKMFSVEKRATKSVWTKHLWFDGKKKKWISTSTFVPFIRCENRNSHFSYQISNERFSWRRKCSMDFSMINNLTAEKSLRRVKWKAEVLFCQSLN